MDNDSANTLATSFLKGAFDVLDAMLSVSFSYTTTTIAEANREDIEDLLSRFPLVMQAVIKSGGPIALMFQTGDASRFASMVLGEAPIVKAALDENDLGTLREVAEPCIGGGVTNLMEKFGRGVEAPEQVSVDSFRLEDAQEIDDFLGAGSTFVEFDFSAAPDINGKGALLLSERMTALMSSASSMSAPPPPPPPPPPPQPRQSPPPSLLGEDELGDILSAFGPPPPSPPSQRIESTSLHSPVRPAPPNLDMVLDIRLVATARLGRIEMPLGDVLSLGPGSIIPVGHLVDEPVELLVNDKLIARGDVVVVDERFGLRITEIVSAKDRIESLH